MFSKAYLSFMQFLFLALATDAMPEPFLRDTTDMPDDQKEFKELESSRGDGHIFPPHVEYEDNILNFHKASEAFPDFSYHLDFPEKKESSLDDISVTGLDAHGDMFSDNVDLSKRGNHRSRPGGQKFRFDPALNRLGLGKRDSDRPKYNPGWKFIGLGKRIMPFLGLNPPAFNMDEMERRDFKMGAADALIPYYRILAMHDVGMFLDDIKERVKGNQRRNNRSQSSDPDRLPLDLYSLELNEESSPKVKHSMSGIFAVNQHNGNPVRSSKPQPFFTRSRKPTTMWRNKSKPMYDPGYLMTGLGK